ncbi:cellulase family glycosylhydrolase [Mycolicibacterium frederiksbergense]|uniref:cellulase family glycosylhydrolase n=1 Tax=Mycolicibacterium frederiksbergense TaxID=117567 RepID=UPI00143C8054|nr:cellulase family glycosylhydrolase [Mycolicibacterium frederiksbergense]
MPLTKQRSYNVMQVAQIDEAPSTIGIADSELYLSASLEEINARLDLMQSLGVTNVRIMVPWAGVQPLHPDTPFGLGAPRWDQLDKVVNAAAARGMGILGVLNSTPMWATGSTPINGQPTDFDRFAAFAKSVALRYGDKISAYEVWNEPNSIQFWNTLDPAAYAEMLKKTYTALKQAAAQIGTDITVIGGVIGAGKTWPGLTMNPVDFVRGMYEAGAHGYFDALSFHPYNFEWKFSVGDSLPWKEGMPLYQLNQIREMMDSFLEEGQEQIKIWITEYGLPTNKVSDATQAAFVRDLIEFWQTMQGAGPIFLYTIKDWLNPPADNDEANLGIFRPDGTMKPVGQVIQELIAFLTKPPTDPGTDPGTGPGPGPGAEAPPANPFAVFLQAISQAIAGMFNVVPNLFTAIGAIFSNLLGGLFGMSPSSARTTALSARTASAGVDGLQEPVESAEGVEEVVAEPGQVVETGSEAVQSVQSVQQVQQATGGEAVTEELPVAEVPVTEELPVVEVPVTEEVTEEAPVVEVTDSEETVTAPAEESTESTETVNETVTEESEATEKPLAGNQEAAVAESTDTVGPEVRKVAVPNLKARQTLSTRTPRGPRVAARATSDSGQGGSAPTRQRAAAGSPSGGDR